MEFYLNYHGVLSTTGHAKQKFMYRRVFAKQLQELYRYYQGKNIPEAMEVLFKTTISVGPFQFLPLITNDSNREVDLEIVLLSQSGPSGGKQSVGDLDNLLKSLIDGLRMAQNMNEVRREKPTEGESPFFCLLEDDQVIRNITISHKKLFFPSKKPVPGRAQEIFALIKVKIVSKFY